jgi:hypothetical protein
VSSPPDLQLPPISARIARHLARLDARLPDAFVPPSSRGPVDTVLRDISREPRPLAQFVEPRRMLRLKVTDEPRAVERPAETDDQLAEATPQFILRNTDRLERDADTDELIYSEYKAFRDALPWDEVSAAHRCERPPLDPAEELSSHKIALLLAERRVVMVETPWHELYGRPDELEPTEG